MKTIVTLERACKSYRRGHVDIGLGGQAAMLACRF